MSYTSADYHIGLSLLNINFFEPMNTLADGSCCDSTCDDQTCCAASATTCAPTLRICFRRSEEDMNDVETDCTQQVSRVNGNQNFNNFGTDFAQIEEYYTVELENSHLVRCILTCL